MQVQTQCTMPWI